MLSSITVALPEFVLFIGAMALLMAGVFGNESNYRWISWGGVVILFVAILATIGQPIDATAFGGSYISDDFARIMKVLTYGALMVSLVMAERFLSLAGYARFEFPVLVLLSATGMGIMISANDLIAMYLGIELQSLALYVLATINRRSLRSSEAGLKYFVLGALSSGLLLYGCSLLYGTSGGISFSTLASGVAVGEGSLPVLQSVGIVFVLAGLAFKVSAVPFHMWTPDVYEGSPTPVTALFSAAPKVAAFALIARLLFSGLPAAFEAWQQILIFIALASMILGAFSAIGQSNVKRLMAYSSIGHMGFALVGLASGTAEGISGMIVYLAIYATMTLGTFACLLALRTDTGMLETIDDLAGLSRSRPALAAALAILMFSLAGIPPLAGFFGKFYVFRAAVNAELYSLAILGVLASVVGAFYYLRVVKIMYLDAPTEADIEPMPRELGWIAVALSGFSLLFFVYPAPLISLAHEAAILFVDSGAASIIAGGH